MKMKSWLKHLPSKRRASVPFAWPFAPRRAACARCPQPCQTPRQTLPQFHLPPHAPRLLRAVAHAWEAFWTRFAGAPRHPGEHPLLPATPQFEMGLTLARALLGLALGAGLVALAARNLGAEPGWVTGPALLLAQAFGWFLVFILVTGAMRKAVTTLVHEAIHGTLTASPGFNRWFARVTTALLFTQPEELYREEHVGQHHPFRSFATVRDPDCAVLIYIVRIYPGIAPAEARRRLARAPFSPRVHAYFLWSRLHGNTFNRAVAPGRRALALGLQAAILAAVALAGTAAQSWQPVAVYVLAWLLPLTLGFSQSAVLQFASEHLWCYRHLPDATGPARAVIERGLINRHVCARWPRRTGRLVPDAIAIARWSATMLTVGLFWRGFVLPGTLCVHGFHHLHPGGTPGRWPLDFYANARSQAAGDTAIPTHWTMRSVYDAVFATLARVPPQSRPDTRTIFSVTSTM